MNIELEEAEGTSRNDRIAMNLPVSILMIGILTLVVAAVSFFVGTQISKSKDTARIENILKSAKAIAAENQRLRSATYDLAQNYSALKRSYDENAQRVSRMVEQIRGRTASTMLPKVTNTVPVNPTK